MIFSGWFGHIQRLVGREVRGGLRQSMWYRRGQKSHWMSAPTRQLLKITRGETLLHGSGTNHHILQGFTYPPLKSIKTNLIKFIFGFYKYCLYYTFHDVCQ